MSIEITGANVASRSNYTVTNDIKKADYTSKDDNSKEESQDLGNDTFVKSTGEDTANSTYKPVKNKLSAEEIKAIKEDQDNSKAEFIKKFISDTISNQNKILGKSTDSGMDESLKKTTDLLTQIFGSVENAYPPIETDPEAAKQAIAEGGTYSVNAVADRIMTMAKAIAGDDPDKIQQMRAAVEKGFSEAGVDFKQATNSELPQICKDTCSEVMKRFDELQNKTSNNVESE